METERPASHTPGPWIMATAPSSVVGWPIVSQQGRSIASLTYVQPTKIDPHVPGDRAFNAESRANAHLIAAAPELLEALKTALDEVHSDIPAAIRTWPRLARAAIAKAEGK